MSTYVLCAVLLLTFVVASESRSPPLEVIAVDEDDDILEAFLLKSGPRGAGRFSAASPHMASRKLWPWYQRDQGEGPLDNGHEKRSAKERRAPASEGFDQWDSGSLMKSMDNLRKPRFGRRRR